jgi:hypothetical protein
MRDSSRTDPERASRVGIAALAAAGAVLLVAAAWATYEASLAKAHAVHEVVRASPEGASNMQQYLPGSSSQIGTLPEPLMEARRAALRAGFDADEAPVDAFDRLRSVPGHDEEARGLLAQYWERRSMEAGSPLERVLYALQARIVDDDDGHRRTAASAMTALGPLRQARHVAEGAILAADSRTLVLQGSGWLHVVNLEADSSFDLSGSDAGPALVDGRRMVTWGDDTARIWDLDPPPSAPAASFKLLAGETPLSFAGGCVLTSDGRVWRSEEGETVSARGKWIAGSINPTCDRVVLIGEGIASYRRRGRGWVAEPVRAPGKAPRGSPMGKAGEERVEACATQAPRCVLRDSKGTESVASVWDFGASPPRRLYDGVDCEVRRLSPDGTRLMCSESQDGITFYREDDAGAWLRTDVVLPPLGGVFLEDDGTLCGLFPPKDPSDRSDVLFFAAHPCWTPPAAERAWGSIRMLSSGRGAVFSYPPTGQGASGYTEFLGFDSKGESLAAASGAWFGERTDERLLEHDATNSAGEKSYELAGAPFDPTRALGDPDRFSSVEIDQAYFVESPEPSLIFEIGFVGAPPAAPGQPLRAVARWDLRGKHFCGPAIAGALTSLAPNGDAIVIDGRIYRVGVCTSDRGFDPTEATGVVAVGPGAARWIARDGESLQLQGPQLQPSAVPRAEKATEAQIAFSPGGDRFFVRTADSLCKWVIRDDGALDLDACRWSTGGWVSDAAWAPADKTGETVLVFDRTADGAALRRLFGSHDPTMPSETGGDLACTALPRPDSSPVAVLQSWEERLGHRFKEQPTPLQDTLEMTSPEIVPLGAIR